MIIRTQALLAAVLILSCGASAHAATATISTDNTSASVEIDGKPALTYKYGDVPFKPYVQKLYSPAGLQVLLDAPHDHLHHHALMYAITVDGVNFWEEATAPGRQSHISIYDVIALSNNDGSTAGFKQTLEWENPRTEQLLLNESRQIELRRTNKGPALLTWMSTFTLPEGKDSATLSGSPYFGLGMRLVRSMDGGAFTNADGKQGEVYRGSERLLSSKWCAYTAKVDDKTVTVAMFDDPDNARHPATWFIMEKPFAYLSATLNLSKEPLEMTAGKPLALRYGVALWDGEVDKKTIDKACKDWISLSNDE